MNLLVLLTKKYKKFLNKYIYLININDNSVSLDEKTNTYFKTGLFKKHFCIWIIHSNRTILLASDEDLKKIKGNENQKIISFAIDHFEKYQLDRNILGETQNDLLSFQKIIEKFFSHYF